MSQPGYAVRHPVVFATCAIDASHTEWMFDLVFVLVVMFTLIQTFPITLAPRAPWPGRGDSPARPRCRGHSPGGVEL